MDKAAGVVELMGIMMSNFLKIVERHSFFETSSPTVPAFSLLLEPIQKPPQVYPDRYWAQSPMGDLPHSSSSRRDSAEILVR